MKKSKSKKKAKSNVKPAAKKVVKKIMQKSTAVSANKTGVNPLGDRVLVKPFSAEEMHTTNSFGLIIPDTVSKEKAEQGTVVAVGAGKKNDEGRVIAPSVAVGDTVMFSKYGFDEIKVNGVEYYILPESSILAVLTK